MEARRAFRVFWICGLAGVLVDLDHIASLILWKLWFPWITEGRIWHTPLFILSCLGICYLVSSLGGFYPKLVLVGVVAITVLILVYSPLATWGLTK